MPYIGHSPTQAGSYIEVDDFGSSFNGSNVAFTLQVGGVNITPNQQNLLVMIDGVLQQPSDAFSVSGSTITFTEAPANGADLYCLLMGQSASIGNGTIGADELKISGNGTSGQLLKSDGDGTYSYLNQNSVTAGTATTLATARTINGVSFDGSANITVTADANTLSNTTLKSTVVNSSLTSVGTLSSLTVSGEITSTGASLNLDNASQVNIRGITDDTFAILAKDKSENAFKGQIAYNMANADWEFYTGGVASGNKRLDLSSSGAVFSGAITANTGSKITSSSADTTFSIETTIGTTIFPILDFVSSHSSVGGKIRQDGSDVISFDNSQNTTFAGNVSLTKDGARLFVNSADYELVSIGRAGSSGSALDQGYLRMKNAGTNTIALHTAGDSYFNGGKVGIGTSSPGQLLEVASAGNAYIAVNADSTGAGSDNAGVLLQEAGNDMWTIRNEGNTSNRLAILDEGFDDGVQLAQNGSGFSDISDERTKTDLVTITDAVDKINSLRAVNFKWKYGNKERRTKNNIGIIAQDVYKVLPEAVTIPEEDYKVVDHPKWEGEKQAQNVWTVDKGKLTILLIKAVQELSAKVEALENA